MKENGRKYNSGYRAVENKLVYKAKPVYLCTTEASGRNHLGYGRNVGFIQHVLLVVFVLHWVNST